MSPTHDNDRHSNWPTTEALPGHTASYRNSLPKINKARSMLEIALDVHTTNTGAYERSKDLQQLDIWLLEKRLLTWLEYSGSHQEKGFHKFDKAVKHLIEVVLEEAKK